MVEAMTGKVATVYVPQNHLGAQFTVPTPLTLPATGLT
jgi:hypothetical protein